MNVKKYRATTTREALEMIKQDLGEGAFVLDTKRVRTGGFLGLRSSMQMEVSAASPTPDDEPKVKQKAKTTSPSHRLLNLTDDTIAVPQASGKTKYDPRETIMTALAARAVSSDDLEKSALRNQPASEAQKIETVEINSEAPRFVHPKKPISIQFLPEQNAPSTGAGENAYPSLSHRDFESLRAEMREMKFSLGAFAGRQNVNSSQIDIDPSLPVEISDPPFREVYDELTATGVSADLACKFVKGIVSVYNNDSVRKDQLAKMALFQAVSSTIRFEPDPLQRQEANILAIVGATGVGKTTTVAKLAARVALYEHRPVELVTLDTYRIAAVEQLKTYAEIIGAGCHVVRSVFELDAVLRRLPSDATVLIDTTGRNPHDLADQFELSDYLRQRSEIRKCLVVQATTHPIDASAAIKKFEMYGVDCLAVTKLDETLRPGAIIETINESGLPLAYFCTGQRVPEDLQIATTESLTSRILGKRI